MVSIESFLQTDIFSFVLPFMLVFALSFAFLANVIKNRQSRVMISVLLGLLVLPFAPQLSIFLSRATGGFLVVVGAIILLVILIELSGFKASKKVDIKQEDGSVVKGFQPVHIFEKYGVHFAIILIGLAILIFIQSGGLDLLGIGGSGGGNTFDFLSAPLIFFVAIIAIMAFWMSTSSKR